MLDHKHAESDFEAWNKIALYEDDLGNIHLKNLSIHKIDSEDDAIDLLMMGNFIRQVSSTPMNMASSRSHCIFTIAFESRDPSSDLIRTSKLHLVDLAGSERVFKKNSQGAILEEAKHINLSLSYLEQVIIALYEKANGNRVHIPYRNSMMTTILRDSLGGNCRTVMVANLSAELGNIDESISTARFAQRCSMLVNEIHVNQHIDLNLVIKRLEEENASLRREIELAGGEAVRRGLTREEEEKTQIAVERFLVSEDTKDPEIGTREELLCGLKHAKRVIHDRDVKYAEEVDVLNKQIAELGRQLATRTTEAPPRTGERRQAGYFAAQPARDALKKRLAEAP